MGWDELLFEFESLVSVWPEPNILILHLGGNDIGQMRTLDLIFGIRDTIQILRESYPQLVIVFSEIVPRLRWLDAGVCRPFEKVRKRVNKAVEKFMVNVTGFSYRHIDLEGGLPGLYRSDGVHLSEVGLDIFNMALQGCIERAAVLGSGASQG